MITTVQTRSRMPDRLNFPYGGELIDLIVSSERAFELKRIPALAFVGSFCTTTLRRWS